MVSTCSVHSPGHFNKKVVHVQCCDHHYPFAGIPLIFTVCRRSACEPRIIDASAQSDALPGGGRYAKKVTVAFKPPS